MASIKEQTTGKGFAILSAAGMISKILSVAFVPLLTLILTNEGNGIYNAGYQIYAFIYVIANQGAPVAISKLVAGQLANGKPADAKHTFELALRFMLALGIVLTAATFLLARPAAKAIGYASADLTIMALAPTMLFTCLASAYRGYFQGRKNMSPTAVSQVLEQIVHGVFAIAGAYAMRSYGAGVAAAAGLAGEEAATVSLMYASMGATFGTSFGAAVSWGYLYLIYRRSKPEIRLEAAGSERTLSTRDIYMSLLKLVIPISLGAALVNTANLVDLINVKARLLAAGFSEKDATSLYGILTTHWQKIINIPLALVTAMSVAIIPQISAAASTGDRRLMRVKMRYAYNIVWSLTIPAAVGMAVLADPLLTALYPTTVQPTSVVMMQIGTAAVLLIALVNIQTAILQALGRVYVAPITMASALVIKIVINYFLCADPKIHVIGAVISTIICYVLAAAVNQYFVRRYAPSCGRGIFKLFGLRCLAAAVMGAVTYGAYALLNRFLGGGYFFTVVKLAVPAIIGAAVYFGMLAALNLMKKRKEISCP